jgi:hypothetical protein
VDEKPVYKITGGWFTSAGIASAGIAKIGEGEVPALDFKIKAFEGLPRATFDFEIVPDEALRLFSMFSGTSTAPLTETFPVSIHLDGAPEGDLTTPRRVTFEIGPHLMESTFDPTAPVALDELQRAFERAWTAYLDERRKR